MNGCTSRTPPFLAVRLPNLQKKSRASARFHPPAAARKGDLHVTKAKGERVPAPLNLPIDPRRGEVKLKRVKHHYHEAGDEYNIL